MCKKLNNASDNVGKDVSKTISDKINIERNEEQSFSERLALLTAVSNELSKAKTLDELCRRAVEAGREQLGFDRVALFFVTADHGTMIGTMALTTKGGRRKSGQAPSIVAPRLTYGRFRRSAIPAIQNAPYIAGMGNR